MKNKNKKNLLETKIKKNKVITIILFVSILLLIFLLILASYFRNFGNITLTKNTKEMFSIGDLTVNDVKYGDKESTIIKSLGYPEKEKKMTKGSYKYKNYIYDGLKLTLKENQDNYVLVKAEITSGKYKTSRNVKVNQKITKVLKKYRIDNKQGPYMYQNYSKKALSSIENKSNIFFGVRSSKNILYVNRDKVIEELPTNIASLNIEYKHGVVKKIIWSYDVQ